MNAHKHDFNGSVFLTKTILRFRILRFMISTVANAYDLWYMYIYVYIYVY